MHYVLQVVKALYFDFLKMQYDKRANHREVTRFKRLRKEISSQQKHTNAEPILNSREPIIVVSKPDRKPHSVQSAKRREKV